MKIYEKEKGHLLLGKRKVALERSSEKSRENSNGSSNIQCHFNWCLTCWTSGILKKKHLYFGSVFDHQCRPLELGLAYLHSWYCQCTCVAEARMTTRNQSGTLGSHVTNGTDTGRGWTRTRIGRAKKYFYLTLKRRINNNQLLDSINKLRYNFMRFPKKFSQKIFLKISQNHTNGKKMKDS